MSQKIRPCLWFESGAQEAAEFYVSLFPDSHIEKPVASDTDTPGGKAGDVMVVEFTLAGRDYLALNGGPHDQFNDAISMSVNCKDQAEIDRLWEALTADGGKAVRCGWLKDKYGLSWQIMPEILPELMSGADPARSKRVMDAMMQMVKMDIAKLKQAYDG